MKEKYIELNPNDVVFTPDKIAKFMVNYFKPKGKILEPCKGEGVFLKYLPKNTEWCEITEGKDFFDYNKKIDWIVTNPPYSNWNKFLNHCFKICDNIVFLVPLNKVFNSYERIKFYESFGGIVEILMTAGNKCGFPFGFPVCVIYFKRDYNGLTRLHFDLFDLINKFENQSLEVFQE